MNKITSELRVRMSAKDAHYGGNLVDGAHMLHLFGIGRSIEPAQALPQQAWGGWTTPWS